MPRYLRVSIIAVLLALASLGMSVGVASATTNPTPTPVYIPGNPSCEGGLKIEPVRSGTYGPITITVNGPRVRFSSTVLVTSVIVKGGPNANLYDYGTGVKRGSGLTAPINPRTNRPYGLSHVCFFTA